MKIPLLELGSGSESTSQAGRAWGMLRDEGYLYLRPNCEVNASGLECAARQFFSQPLHVKMRYYIGNSPIHRGYLPIGEVGEDSVEPDMKEAYDSGLQNLGTSLNAVIAGKKQVPWPEISNFGAHALAYMSAIAMVAHEFSNILSLAMGMQHNFLCDRARNPPNQLRILHYPPAPTARVGIGCHTDFECFTLMHSTDPGLVIRRPKGDWIAPEPVPGTLILILGDLAEILTNGVLRAAEHRVDTGPSNRISLAYFYSLDANVEVEPIPRFVGDLGKRYESVRVADHIIRRTTEVFHYLRSLHDEQEA